MKGKEVAIEAFASSFVIVLLCAFFTLVVLLALGLGRFCGMYLCAGGVSSTKIKIRE